MTLSKKSFNGSFDSGSGQLIENGIDELFSSNEKNLFVSTNFDEDSTENKLNKARASKLDENYTRNFTSPWNEYFESDYLTQSEEILNEQLKISDEDSTENKLNKARASKLDKNYTKNFVSLLKEEDFEFGYSTRSEEILNEQLKVNALATRNWLNEIFIKNFYADESIIIGIVRIIGRFSPEVIFPQGQTIALASLSHSNDEIKELGIRAFEQWGPIKSLNILKSLNVESTWLKEYVQDVISDFEEQLCLY